MMKAERQKEGMFRHSEQRKAACDRGGRPWGKITSHIVHFLLRVMKRHFLKLTSGDLFRFAFGG